MVIHLPFGKQGSHLKVDWGQGRGGVSTLRYLGFPRDSVQLFTMANWGLVLPMNPTLGRQPHLCSSPASAKAGGGQSAESTEG